MERRDTQQSQPRPPHCKSLDLLNELKRMYSVNLDADSRLIGIISRIVSSHDFDFGAQRDHAIRVGALAGCLAQNLGFAKIAKLELVVSGLLHDIGKSKLPPDLLNKPERLTEQERDVIETHTLQGFEMLTDSKVDVFQIPAAVALCHHEQWDGNGYPNGMKAESIPVAARIVAVADVYDALTSRRAYREALHHTEAIRTMMQARSTQFDPMVFDAFEAMLSVPTKVDEFVAQSVYDLELLCLSSVP